MGHLTCVAEPSVCWAGAEEEGNVYGALRWLTPVIHSMCVLTLGHRDSPTTDEQCCGGSVTSYSFSAAASGLRCLTLHPPAMSCDMSPGRRAPGPLLPEHGTTGCVSRSNDGDGEGGRTGHLRSPSPPSLAVLREIKRSGKSFL